ALDDAEVALLMLDAQEGVTDQDLSLISYILDAGRALVIALNKWDGLSRDARRHCRAGIDRKLEFVTWAQVITLSALQGSGFRELMRAIDRAHAAAHRSLGTPALTRALEQAYTAYQPPLVRGHAPKLRYAHLGGNHPPTIIIHGSRTKHLAPTYIRYLENFFRKRFRLFGTPVRIHFREGENPFAGHKNVLSGRQLRKRKRLLQHVRGKH
ncbi:MAG TPA: ribosome biogenesis GTPase Der, partial [Mizugakiibacter sp.]|nr:ribosome biogenesis GTPase Der [Mizugakiibacter sp.]